MCPEMLKNLMYDCFLDLLIGNPPKDDYGFYLWLDDLDNRIHNVLSAVGVLSCEDDLEIGECLV